MLLLIAEVALSGREWKNRGIGGGGLFFNLKKKLGEKRYSRISG